MSMIWTSRQSEGATAVATSVDESGGAYVETIVWIAVLSLAYVVSVVVRIAVLSLAKSRQRCLYLCAYDMMSCSWRKLTGSTVKSTQVI